MLNVSVIVPVYNAALYLERCLNSLLCQTLMDIEIICIDDGSTDATNNILQQFAEQDSRLKVIVQVNQGVSAARNAGIRIAQGEYLSFVDADDWVEADFLEILYNTARNEQTDIVVCDYFVDKDENRKPKKAVTQGICLSQRKALEYALRQDKYQGFLWNKLFRRTLFQGNNIWLDTELFVLEDLLCTCQCMLHTPSVFYQPIRKYHYSQTIGSTFRVNEKTETMFLAAQKLMDLFRNYSYDSVKRLAASWHCYSAGVLFLYYTGKNERKKAQFYHQEQKRYLKEYLWVYKTQPQKLMRGILIACMPKLAARLKQQMVKG